jgi:hypothetical protein
MIAQHHQAAQRRAGHHRLLPGAQKPDIRDMEPVHILGRVDRVDHQIRVQMPRQRQLHQDPVHRRVLVQPPHQRQQVGLRGVRRQPVLERGHADLDRLLALRTHIDLAGRILAHQHHRQPRHQPVIGLQGRDMGRHIGADAGRKGLAVKDRGRHRVTPG